MKTITEERTLGEQIADFLWMINKGNIVHNPDPCSEPDIDGEIVDAPDNCVDRILHKAKPMGLRASINLSEWDNEELDVMWWDDVRDALIELVSENWSADWSDKQCKTSSAIYDWVLDVWPRIDLDDMHGIENALSMVVEQVDAIYNSNKVNENETQI